MQGVMVNVVGIVLGTVVGLLVKRRLAATVSNAMETGLGFCTLVIGMKMGLAFEDVFCVIGCVLVGGVLGTLFQVESKIDHMGVWLQTKLGTLGSGLFAKGFSISSVLYCTGAMAVVGSIQSSIQGNHDLLYTKATLDGVIAISFAAIYGIGVAFSALSVFVYQGSIVFLASYLDKLSSPDALADISGVGGILILMIGMNLLKIRKVSVGDFLPAMVLVMLFHLVF